MKVNEFTVKDKMVTMKLHQSITQARVLDACDRRDTTLDNPGFCIACGDEANACEPDATKYRCSSCSKSTVYAPEELLFRGWYYRGRPSLDSQFQS